MATYSPATLRRAATLLRRIATANRLPFSVRVSARIVSTFLAARQSPLASLDNRQQATAATAAETVAPTIIDLLDN